MQKPYSESCDQNKLFILSVIKPLLSNCIETLEIGSGTGQHAVYFAEEMPHIRWHCSDCDEYIAGINHWIKDSGLANVLAPVILDVSLEWPKSTFDAVFTANSVHIMHFKDVVNLFKGVTQVLHEGGHFLIYGPFNYNGSYTSPSNESFDQWLKNRDTLSGIKDFEDIESLAKDNGLILAKDYEMPANNRILHFKKL